MMSQNLWDAAKAVLKGKFMAIQSYLKKQERNLTDNLTLHLKKLENEEQAKTKKQKPKSAEGKIIKSRTEINEREMKETIAKINKTKSWFFEKINKTDTPLTRLIKKKEKNQINKIRNEKGEVRTDNTKIQKILRIV